MVEGYKILNYVDGTLMSAEGTKKFMLREVQPLCIGPMHSGGK